MLREIETAHALGDAERQLAGRIGVLVAGGVIVVEHDDVGAGELLAVRLDPFRPLARLARAVGVAGRGNTERPEVVRILLAFDAGDRCGPRRSPSSPRRRDR